MKHVAAALLVALSGSQITEKSINDVLASVGIKSNPTVVRLVVEACKNKTSEQIIQEGLPKLSSTVVSAAVAEVKVEKKDEKKKDEPKKKEEPKVEEEEEMGFGDLF